jgi:glycosidase
MAKDTLNSNQSLVIYQVFIRNYGEKGTFSEIEQDLPRIKSMGVDLLYFLPIHPVGKINRKGSLGSPYSIADYEAVNPEYGSKADFKRLIEKAHSLNLRIMIDVVFNHTAHDSKLVKEHPEWFHQDQHGKPITTVPEWSDVIDMNHASSELSEYLIKVLQDWAIFGVDAFRCDVASLIPVKFWQEARVAVSKIKDNVIWLAESVYLDFIALRRSQGLTAFSDSELYTAFDVTYDYDVWHIFQAAVMGKISVHHYLEMLHWQDCIYPANYIKMRCVENHDQERIMKLAPDAERALAWTAFAAFNKGPFLIYAGQESGTAHKPSLFEIDKVEWGDFNLQGFMTSLAMLKKEKEQINGKLYFLDSTPAIQTAWISPQSGLYGIFNVSGRRGKVSVQLPDGEYIDLISLQKLLVHSGEIELPSSACIVRYQSPQMPEVIRFDITGNW